MLMKKQYPSAMYLASLSPNGNLRLWHNDLCEKCRDLFW